MPFAAAPDGVRLHYERFVPSAKPRPLPVVLIAGWATTGQLWLTAARHGVAAGYEVITTDSRGTGRSELPRRPWSVATLASDVVAVLDDAGIERAHIAGPSLGGMVAQEVALRYPDRVGAMVLAATTGGLPRIDLYRLAGVGRLLYSFASRTFQAADRPAAIRRALALTVTEDFARAARPGDHAWEILVAMMDEPGPVRGNLYGLLAAAAHSTWKRLPGLRLAAQIQHGSADRLISIRAARLLTAAIPGAEIALIEGAGHALILECPEKTMELGLSFLDRHDGTSAVTEARVRSEDR